MMGIVGLKCQAAGPGVEELGVLVRGSEFDQGDLGLMEKARPGLVSLGALSASLLRAFCVRKLGALAPPTFSWGRM